MSAESSQSAANADADISSDYIEITGKFSDLSFAVTLRFPRRDESEDGIQQLADAVEASVRTALGDKSIVLDRNHFVSDPMFLSILEGPFGTRAMHHTRPLTVIFSPLADPGSTTDSDASRPVERALTLARASLSEYKKAQNVRKKGRKKAAAAAAASTAKDAPQQGLSSDSDDSTEQVAPVSPATFLVEPKQDPTTGNADLQNQITSLMNKFETFRTDTQKEIATLKADNAKLKAEAAKHENRIALLSKENKEQKAELRQMRTEINGVAVGDKQVVSMIIMRALLDEVRKYIAKACHMSEEEWLRHFVEQNLSFSDEAAYVRKRLKASAGAGTHESTLLQKTARPPGQLDPLSLLGPSSLRTYLSRAAHPGGVPIPHYVSALNDLPDDYKDSDEDLLIFIDFVRNYRFTKSR